VLADLNLNPEYPLEALSPRHGHATLARRLVLRLIRCFGVAAFAPLSRRYLHAMLAVGGEYPVKAGKVNSWLGHQGGQSGDEVQSRYCLDPKKSSAVLKKFKEISESEYLDVSFDNIFVIFSAFEPIARIEANENVPENLANTLIQQFRNENIWSVQKLFSALIVFYYSETEKDQAIKTGMTKRFLEAYADIIEPYDEFGYLSSNPIVPEIDSKENFDSNYKGSWFNYWR
jgi:hypothetical protein